MAIAMFAQIDFDTFKRKQVVQIVCLGGGEGGRCSIRTAAGWAADLFRDTLPLFDWLLQII